jgi:hypothetical protein
MVAHAQLLLARPLAAGLRRPWKKQPDPARPLAPGQVRRGFRNIRRELGTPARVAKPSRPGPGRPKGSGKGPAPRHLLPGEADMPLTANTTLTRQKVDDRQGQHAALYRQLKKLPWAAVPATSSVTADHGGRARRTIKVALAPSWIEFAGAAQVAQLRRTGTKGKKTVEVVCLITSIAAANRHHARDPQRTLRLLQTA